MRVALVQRMPEPDVLEFLALHPGDRRAERRPADGLTDRRRQRLGDDHRASVDVVGRVIELGMKRDRQVRRNRPRASSSRSGPRRPARPAPGCAPPSSARIVGRQRKLDVDRRRGVILVLDFRFGQRGAAVDAPVDRLLALVDEPLLDEPAERARDRRLVLEVHRQVRVVPGAEDAEPLELLGHRADEALGVRAAGAAEVGDRHLRFFGPSSRSTCSSIGSPWQS